MKLFHNFVTQLAFKYFIANGTASLGEIEAHFRVLYEDMKKLISNTSAVSDRL